MFLCPRCESEMKEEKIRKGELGTVKILECLNCGYSEIKPEECLRNN